jgi:hypothetical protein
VTTLLILKTSLQRAATIQHIPFPIYWNYWISALMCTLQFGLSKGVIVHTNAITETRSFPDSFQTSDSFIQSFSHIRTPVDPNPNRSFIGTDWLCLM